jgi:hypothetical protein
MFRLLLGTATVLGAGYVAKKYYSENQDNVNEKIEDGLISIYEWLDEKSVALDKYLDSLDEEKNSTFYSVEDEITFESLQRMKKKVYHDSFVDFINLFGKVENVDLGKLEYQEINFNSNIYADNLFDETIQNNLKITTDLLFKANNLLNDIVNNLEAIITKDSDYKSFKTKEKELLKDAFSLAKFIQKICISETLDENIVLKFNNIISSIQEEI